MKSGMLILLCAPAIAIAHGWDWLQLCKHRTGQTVEGLLSEGIKTQGRRWVDLNKIVSITPLVHDKCVIIEFDDGTKASVAGSYCELWKKMRHNPGCSK